MIKLYHCPDARSFRCLWLLEELGLPYELEIMVFPPRRTMPEFLTENPLGTIPLLVDGATRMTESVAILQYLSDGYGNGALSLAPGDGEYGAFLDWLYYGEATLTTPQTITLRYRHLEPDERKQPAVADDYARILLDRVGKAEDRLAQADYLCAGRFTIADISVAYALLLARKLGFEPRFRATTLEYWSRMQARPAFQRAKQKQRG